MGHAGNGHTAGNGATALRLARPVAYEVRPVASPRRLRRSLPGSDVRLDAAPTMRAPVEARPRVGAAPRQPRPGGEVLLRAEGVRVVFGGLVANDDVAVEVREATVTALIGPNGAGKTTFFNVLTGAQRPAAGRMWVGGRELTGASRAEIARAGVARTFQNLQLFESLTLEENVLVGATRYARSGLLRCLTRSPFVRQDEAGLRRMAARALEVTGLAAVAHERAADLSYGDRRRAEIARALALGPDLLLLDEPSAGMDPNETADLGQLISRVVDAFGIAVLMVEHDMSMVRDFVDYVYVLDFGKLIVDGRPVEVLRDPRVIEAYLGSREGNRA